MITTVCKISYGSQTVPPIVPAVQGDTGRAISFEIADFTPPAGATATYFILKPSGEAIYNSATITNNSILCELTAQSLAEAGENRMQVRVLQGEDIVTSFEVILMVRTFLGDDAIESGTEMNIFDQAVEQATEQFQENAEQIVEEVIESIPADYTELTDEVDELNERIDNLKPGLSDEAKVALLACFENVAWINNQGQTYYDNLETALYADEYPKITATYNPGTNVVFTDDALDSLKQYLTVKYYTNKTDTGTVISSANYTLSGTLSEGENVIRVGYSDCYAVFTANAVDINNIWEWSTDDAYAKITDLGGCGCARINGALLPVITVPGPSAPRKGFCATHGDTEYVYNDGTTIAEDLYPIPIPEGATKMTCYMPNGQYWGGAILGYANNTYYWQNSPSWTASGGSFDLPANYTKRFYCPNLAMNPTTDSFPTGEPSFFRIVFE